MNPILKAMSDYVFTSRYARYSGELKRRLSWNEVVKIVENMHLEKYPQIEEEIRWAFDLVRDKVVLGSQRALQFGGEPIFRHMARLYNCSASYCDRPRFFQEAMYLLLCGCGVGYSIQKHHVAKLPKIKGRDKEEKIFVIPDSIEGWSDAIGVLLSSYFVERQEFIEYFGYKVKFDYSKIRPEGSPLSSGVGKAPGHKGLKASLEKIERLLESLVSNTEKEIKIRPINALDILCHLSDSVLSGGIRRSSGIALFSKDDNEMMNAKTGDWRMTNPQRGRSNNSVVLKRNEVDEDFFKSIIEKVKQFGEPGFIFVDNKESLVNPCAEISMIAYETFEDNNGKIIRDSNGFPKIGRSGWAFCNLTEINGKKIKNIEDFKIAVRGAAIIGTCQAGYTSFPYLGEVTENIVKKEALLGCSITGIMDSPDILLNPEIQREMAKFIIKTNEEISKKIGINPAARVTAVKPAGTTSLILGTASGIHPHHAKRYFRRIQSNKNEMPLQFFKMHNPIAVEESQWSVNKTDEIITFCIEVPKGAKVKNQISALELLETVKLTQQNWVLYGTVEERCVIKGMTHNVSNTIHVKDNEWDEVSQYIYDNRMYFTGISLSSVHGDKDYVQAPNCAVYTPLEILHEYGDGSLLASGLIVDGLKVFDELWNACDCALDIGEALYPADVKRLINSSPEEKNRWEEIGIDSKTKYALIEGWLKDNVKDIKLKRDWIRRAKQFARRYFNDDLRKMTYCLKDVRNMKLWLDLNREYVDVDYTKLIEDRDNTKIQETVACGGGACEINI
jgi:ribonucleoside-diphosphate reductase alpha chain